MDRRQKLHKSAGKITIALDFGILPKVRSMKDSLYFFSTTRNVNGLPWDFLIYFQTRNPLSRHLEAVQGRIFKITSPKMLKNLQNCGFKWTWARKSTFSSECHLWNSVGEESKLKNCNWTKPNTLSHSRNWYCTFIQGANH